MTEDVHLRVMKLDEAVRSIVDHVSSLPGPVPRSVISADDRLCPGVELSVHIGHHLFPSAMDHIWYLTNSIIETKRFPVFGSYTLARSTIEIASTMLWVLTPQERKDRLTRHLRLEWANLFNARQMLETQNDVGAHLGYPVNSDDPHDFVAGRLASLVAAAGRIDLSDKDMKRTPKVTSIISEAASGIGESPQVLLDWRIASGAAHGKSWSGLVTRKPAGGWGNEARLPADGNRSAGISTMVDIAERALVVLQKGLGRLEKLRATAEPQPA